MPQFPKKGGTLVASGNNVPGVPWCFPLFSLMCSRSVSTTLGCRSSLNEVLASAVAVGGHFGKDG